MEHNEKKKANSKQNSDPVVKIILGSLIDTPIGAAKWETKYPSGIRLDDDNTTHGYSGVFVNSEYHIFVSKKEIFIFKGYDQLIYRGNDSHNIYDRLYKYFGDPANFGKDDDKNDLKNGNNSNPFSQNMYGPYNNPYFQQPNNVYSMYGYQHAPFSKPIQPLTQEEIDELKQDHNDMVNISLSRKELLKAKCTHKFKDGRYSLLPVNPNTPEDGDVVCEICGAQFNLNHIDEQDLIKTIKTVQTAIEQTKAFWPDIPMNVAIEYMIIGPLLDRLVNLYKVAKDRNNKYMNSLQSPFSKSDNPFDKLFGFDESNDPKTKK